MDIQQLRRDTPGTIHAIHLNNAGAALPPLPVIQAVRQYWELEAQIGGYEAMAIEAEAIEGFYSAFAKLVNARPRQIAYTTNATHAFNRALSSIPFREGDTILTTNNDYVSNQIAFLYLQKYRNIRVVRAADQPEGGVDVHSMESLVQKHHPRLVAVTHVPTSSGLVQDVAAIGAICRKAEIWYLVDACQSAGQIPLDVQALQCDFLSVTMRKFMRGPRGAGFLYASDRVLDEGLEPAFPDHTDAAWTGPDTYELASTARRYELWERNYALVLGSRAAAEYAMTVGLEAIEKRVGKLAARLRRQLSELPRLRVLDKGKQLCGIVTCHIEGEDGMAIKRALFERHLHTSVAGRGSALLDLEDKNAEWMLRFSPHYYNTEDELDRATGILSDILKK